MAQNFDARSFEAAGYDRGGVADCLGEAEAYIDRGQYDPAPAERSGVAVLSTSMPSENQVNGAVQDGCAAVVSGQEVRSALGQHGSDRHTSRRSCQDLQE